MYAFGTVHTYDGENDQQQNHVPAEDAYLHLSNELGKHGAVRSTSTACENGYHSGEIVRNDSVNYVSNWIPALQLDGNSSSHVGSLNHSETSVPCDSLHLSPTVNLPCGNMLLVPEVHAHHASSSKYVVENSLVDPEMGNESGPYKRKNPGISFIEWGNANSYYSIGGSSVASSSTYTQQDKSKLEVQHASWETVHLPPTLRSNDLSGEGESSTRNVRRRPSFQLDYDIGVDRSGNLPHQMNLNRYPLDHSIQVDHPHHDPTVPWPEWNPDILPDPDARTVLPDASNFCRQATQIYNGSSASSFSRQTPGYHHNLISSRHPGLPQSLAASSAQAARGVRSSYAHRSNPAWVSERSSHMGPAASAEGLQLSADTYSMRHPRLFGSAGGRTADRSGRPRFSTERYRLLSVDAVRHERLTPRSQMIINRSMMYAPRDSLDQHIDMRLDIDNMSYEELLVLGERIGSVNTGVRDDLLPKCLKETKYLSLEPVKKERCTICLEDYQNMEELGTIKACGHDYHSGCIKKWLAIKNMCPICKVAALPDKEKQIATL